VHDCVSNIPPANSTDHASCVQEENLQNFGTSAPFNLQYPAGASTLESAANPSSTSVPSAAGVSALGSLPGDTSGAAAGANSPSPSPPTPRGPLSPSARVATSRERGGGGAGSSAAALSSPLAPQVADGSGVPSLDPEADLHG
jgi:hypothetical protein